MRQRGFAPLIIVFILALAGIGLYFALKTNFFKGIAISPSTNVDVTESPSPTASPSSTTIKNSPTPKPKTTSTPTVKPTPTTIGSTSCNYDLSSSTGAIQFIFNLSKGSSTYWSTQVEIKAQNGCKVLDGKSTDTIQRTKSSTSSTLSVPGIPAGTYNVRYSYNGNWFSYQSVNVSSGGQSNVTFSIDNSSDPTPTPAPTSSVNVSCQVNVLPDPPTSNNVQLVAGNSSNDGSYFVAGQWDFDGNGSWDTDMSSSNQNINHTFSSGSYTVRLQVNMSDGRTTDVCSKSISIP